MKMSEIDHTNSLDPDQAQQNVWQDPKEKGPYNFGKCLGLKKRYSAYSPLKHLEHVDTCWVYDVTYDHFCSLQQATK